MRYVPTQPPAPTDAPAEPRAAVRRAVHGLRAEAERREGAHPAWAGRSLHGALWSAPAVASVGPSTELSSDGAPDALVALLTQLRAVTTRYVCGLRASGARPEQMIVQVKSFVRDAMVTEGWLDPEATRALTAEVVRWSIAAYYDG